MFHELNRYGCAMSCVTVAVAGEVPDALGGDADGVEVDLGALDEVARAVGEETDPRAALFQHGG